MSDLVTWLRAQLDKDELWALAASAPYHGDGPTVPGGVHWTWAIGPDWEHIQADPTRSYVGEDDDDGTVTLVTVEEFPLTWGPRPLAGRVLSSDEEVRTGDGGHIARWDPARVLAEIDAKRRILDEHKPRGLACRVCCNEGYIEEHYDHETEQEWTEEVRSDLIAPCPTVRLLALPYADRPGYQEEWRP